MRPGDLVFDIGAHVGDRVAAFRRLGARIVAVEPQPALAKILRLFYGRDPKITIEQAAVGRQSGTIELNLNIDNPTVSTASTDFVAAAAQAPEWHGQAWPKRVRVPLTTIDALIARHGVPAFIKIDVEGFEAEVLAGLTQPAPALSFEFTLIQRDIALACIERCARTWLCPLQRSIGESQTLVHRIGSIRLRSRAGWPNCRPRPIPETSMRVWADTNRTALLIAAMTAAGFALTLYVFYPGS